MFFRVLLVVFGLFGPGAARAPPLILRRCVLNYKILVKEYRTIYKTYKEGGTIGIGKQVERAI